MQQSNQDSSREENGAPHPNLPFFNFKTIMTATRNCGHENKPGQGRFGSRMKEPKLMLGKYS